MARKSYWGYYVTTPHSLNKIWKRGYIRAPFVLWERPQDAARHCTYTKNRIIIMMELPEYREDRLGNQGNYSIVKVNVPMKKPED